MDIIESDISPSNDEVRILIVDDDPIVLQVMENFVASAGYYFASAGDGLEALAKMRKESFAIVITDINMPNMDGMELLKEVCRKYTKTGVIVITGLSDEYNYIDVINAGAIDYMTKPFNGNELLAKLQRVIREQTLVHELEQISIRDSLTGIYNRRHFDTKITAEIKRAVRQNYQIFLSFLDRIQAYRHQ